MPPSILPRYALRPSVLLAPSSDGYLAYDVAARRLHHLNAMAALLVELCDGTRTVADVHTVLEPLVGDAGWRVCQDWIAAARGSRLLHDTTRAKTCVLPTAEGLTALADRLRDRDEVVAAFVCQHRVTELTPDDPLAWFRLGELAHIVGRREDARRAYEHYFAVRPDDAEVAHLLHALRDEAPPARASDAYVTHIFDRFASFYDRNMSVDLAYRAPEVLREAVGRAMPQDHDLAVLDLGCGTGLSGVVLRDRARSLVGVDLSDAMMARARARRLYDTLHVSEILAFLDGGASGSFDLVVACDTFIYFGDLGDVVAGAARRLLPGGVLAFTVERSDRHPFRLTDSGRYAHHRDHLVEVAGAAGLSVVDLQEAVLRYEYGRAVAGLVTVLRDRRPRQPGSSVAP